MTGINALRLDQFVRNASRTCLAPARSLPQYYAAKSGAVALRLSISARLCVAENAAMRSPAAATALPDRRRHARDLRHRDRPRRHDDRAVLRQRGGALRRVPKSNVVHAPACVCSAFPAAEFHRVAVRRDCGVHRDDAVPTIADVARKHVGGTRAGIAVTEDLKVDHCAPSSGGGGGGGGVLGILAGIAGLAAHSPGTAAAAVAAARIHRHRSGQSIADRESKSPSPSPGALQVSPTSLVVFDVGGAAQAVIAATETNLHGQLTASSPNPAVATVKLRRPR